MKKKRGAKLRILESRFIPRGFEHILPDLFSHLKCQRLGVEEHFLTVKRFREVERALAQARPAAEVIALEDMVEKLRIVKDDAEIDKIRKSIQLTEKALNAVWNALAPGRTELEMAWLIEKTIREWGARLSRFPLLSQPAPTRLYPMRCRPAAKSHREIW